MHYTNLGRWKAKSEVNMNEKKLNKMSGLSALPLIIIIGLILGTGYLLLKDSIDLSFLEVSKDLEMERLENFPKTVSVTKDLDKQRAVIKSEEELINFLSYVSKSKELSLGRKVDFKKEMLIGVSTKTNNTGGYSVKIEKIKVDKKTNNLYITSLITKPSDNCVVTQQLNSAVDIVLVSKTNMDVEFETVRTTDLCE